MYKAGDVKVETTFLPGESKIETRANDEYMSTILRLSEIMDVKQKEPSKTSDRVGVIRERNSTCGSYDQLDITMDCEDTRNRTTSYGWKGACIANGNVTLSFCLVPKSGFQSSKYYKYAVLALDYGVDNMIERHFDNEDGSSINNVKLNGVTLTSDEIYNYIGSAIVQDNNTQLLFQTFPQDAVNGMETFPDLSIPYGVFGSFYVPNTGGTGWISTDDEDTHNANAMWFNWFYIPKVGNEAYELYVQDLVKPGVNTTMYMSRIQ
jgi:hypothetical protein